MENNNITEDQRRNEATQFSILQKKKKKNTKDFCNFYVCYNLCRDYGIPLVTF